MNDKNGHHCHRCQHGTLIRDTNDIICLNCGWRLSFVFGGRVTVTYMAEAITALLLRRDDKALDDIHPRDWKLAGMTANK